MEDDGSSESVGYIMIHLHLQIHPKGVADPSPAVLGSNESCQPQSKTTNLNWRAQQVNVVNV